MNTLEASTPTAPSALTPPSAPPVSPVTPTPNDQPAPQQSQRIKVYFRKVLFSSPIFISGKPVPFQPVPINEGVIALDSADALVEPLSKLAAANRGGIVSITAEDYEEAKKKAQLPTSARRFPPQKLKTFNPILPPVQKPKPQGQPNGGPVRVAQAAASVAAKSENFSRVGVGSVGGGGPDAAGQSASAPTPSPVTFKPATARQSEMRMPVTKKTNSRSLSGGVPEPEGQPEE